MQVLLEQLEPQQVLDLKDEETCKVGREGKFEGLTWLIVCD